MSGSTHTRGNEGEEMGGEDGKHKTNVARLRNESAKLQERMMKAAYAALTHDAIDHASFSLFVEGEKKGGGGKHKTYLARVRSKSAKFREIVSKEQCEASFSMLWFTYDSPKTRL